jgi:hypothetical protein
MTMDTRVVAEELDLTTATSLRELLESAGIAVEMTGGHDTAFPGTPQFGGYGIMVAAADCGQARSLIDELEREAGKPPSQ